MRDQATCRAAILLACIVSLGTVFTLPAAGAEDNPALRWEKDIQAFEQWDAKNAWPKEPVLFAGSSSIRMWKTHEAFANLPVVNRGFGGSQISDVNHYLDRVVLKYEPRVIVFYCGDNDIAAGKSPERVLKDYQAFVGRVHASLPRTQIIFLTIKPSGARWNLWEKMAEANGMVRQFSEGDIRLHYVDLAECLLKEGRPDDSLFLGDRLHLNEDGYERWKRQLRPTLRKALQAAQKPPKADN